MYSAIRGYIGSTAHSNVVGALVWLAFLSSVGLIAFATKVFWSNMKWLAPVLVLGIHVALVFVLVVIFWLPFP